MRTRWREYYENISSAVLAVGLHAGLVVLALYMLREQPEPPPVEIKSVPIHAVAVDVRDLQTEIAQIEHQRQQEIERQEALRLAEQRRIEEEQRKQAEAEHRAEQEKRKAEAQRQAEAERKHKAEQEAKRKVEAEKKRQAEAERKRQAEAERKRQAEAKRKAEAEKKRQAEAERKHKAEQEAKRKAEAEKKRQAEAEQQALRELAESMRRKAEARKIEDLVGRYSLLIQQQVERAWRLPTNSRRGLSCILQIDLNNQGRVLNVRVIRSSGDAAFDRSALAAVERASPFPLPDITEARARFRSFNFKFEPEG